MLQAIARQSARTSLLALLLVAASSCGGPEPDGPEGHAQALNATVWAPSKAYRAGDLVTHARILYRARQAHTSDAQFPPPGNAALWLRPMPTGISEWAYQTEYGLGSDVTYQGLLYECIQAHVAENPAWVPSASPTLWRCASAACGGGCAGKPSGALCDDGNACTTDACNGAGLCVSRPIAACNTGNDKPRALLVVLEAALSPADEVLRRRLVALGYEVDMKTGAGAATSDATGKAVVVISESVTAAQVNTKFRDVRVPVVVLEIGIWDDMRMASDTGNSTDQDRVSIALAAHPLAGGLTGLVTTTSRPGKYNWARTLGGGGRKVATIAGDSSKATIFAYDLGMALIGASAPARRVGMFLSKDVPGSLTAEGERLFDAAITWATAPPALLVVGNTALSDDDQALRDRLRGLNLPVAVVDDSAPAANARGKQVVVISESADSATVGDKFTAFAVPVVSLEPRVWDNLGMTGSEEPPGQNIGSLDDQRAVTIVAATEDHPLAAGLTGTVAVTRTGRTLFWGKPAASAAGVATLTGAPAGSFAIFGYETGASMVYGTAPARRVGWFARADVPHTPTPPSAGPSESWAGTCWLRWGPAGCPARPPARQCSPTRTREPGTSRPR